MGFNFETIVKIILLILALRALHMVSAYESCSEVRRNFVAKRIGNMRLVPHSASQAKDLEVCPNAGFTCCTRAMEARFQIAAKKDVEKVLKYKISSLKYNFKSLSENFRDDVEELFQTARNSTKTTLRKFLEKKRDKITIQFILKEVDNLFDVLRLRSEQDEVMNAFDRFANKLFLVLLDDSYNTLNSDQTYEKCVAQQRVELHPFMNILNITAVNLSKALQVAATFHEALKAGSEAVNVTEGAVLTKSCQKSLLKMQYCSHCFGLTLLKPCIGLCRNVLRGCLAGITEMDEYWNFYITSLVEVTSRMRSMESMYNMEFALDEFKNKFGTSLSQLIENSSTLYETVKKRCQKYRTNKRSKRSADLSQPDIPREETDNSGKKRNRHGRKLRKRTRELLKLKEEKILPSQDLLPPLRSEVLPPHKVLYNPPRERPRKATPQQIVEIRSTTALHSRIRRFITTLNIFVNFYRDLPDNMCEARSSVTIEVTSHGKCWDGSDIVEQYSKDVVPVGFKSQAKNPEVEVLKVDRKVIKAIEQLRNTAKTLFMAAGREKIPALLKSPASYKKRKEQKGNLENPRWPCDDEDDCENLDEEGSAEETKSELAPDIHLRPKTKPSRRRNNQRKPPLIPYEPAEGSKKKEKTHVRLTEDKYHMIFNNTDITFEEDNTKVIVDSHNARKNKRKKGKNRRKEPNQHASTTDVTADGPGGSSSCVKTSITTSLIVVVSLFIARWV